MYLFLRGDWRQLVIDGDGKSSNVGFVVLLHTHACLKTVRESEKEGKRGGEKKDTTFITMLHASFVWRVHSYRTFEALAYRARLSTRVEFEHRSKALNTNVHSHNLPRDNRRGSPLEPPLDVENARWRSTPGITTDVNKPCPLQNKSSDCATFPGASASTSPALSIFIIVTFSLSVSRCNFSTTLAYGESIPVINKMSTLQFFNGKSLRLKRRKLQNFSLGRKYSLTTHVMNDFT